MDPVMSPLSPIDRAVQSITTFTGTIVTTEEDWHSQFAADVDNEELAQPSYAGSKHAPIKTDVIAQRAQSEELTAHQTEGVLEDAPQLGPSTSLNQQPLSKFTPFVRPSSSKEGTYVSFAFGKPQTKQLDFSRKPSQNPKISLPTIQPEPCRSPVTEPRDTQASTTRDVSSVPTEALSPSPSADESPTLVTTMQTTEGSKVLEGTGSTPLNSAAHATTPPDPQGSPVTSANTLQADHCETGEPSGDPNRLLVAAQPISPRASAKITKLRRRSKPRADLHAMKTSQTGASKDAPSYEDTLNVLLMRHRNEQLEWEEARAVLKAKDTELQDLREISNAIYHQLQQVRQREKLQDAELSRFHKVIPQWESRVKRLSDYVQCLSKDHQALHEDARDIRSQQETLQADKLDIASKLIDVRHTVEQDQAKTKEVLVEARHHMEMLEQTVSNQEILLREDANLLDAERDRCQRLEIEISKIATSRQQLSELLAEHGRITSEKLDDLLSKSEEVQIVTPPPSQDLVKPVLDEAVSLFKELRDADVIRPDDLRKLNASVRSYAEEITRSFQDCQKTLANAGAGQQDFVLGFHERLQALSASIATEHALTERLTDLREVKATFRERLQSTETALTEARQQIVALQNKDQLQLQKISVLELEAVQLRDQPKELPQTVFRLHDLEAQNKDLQERGDTLQKHVAEISNQLHQKTVDATQMESQLNTLKPQLEEAQAEKFLLQEQKEAFESQSHAKLEQTKIELCKVANLDKAKIESNHQNRVHQLQQQKSEVDTELKEKVMELDHLQAEKDAVEGKVSQISASLAKSQTEKAKEIETCVTLQSKLNRLEEEMGDKDACLGHLEERLRIAENEIEARNVRIQELDHVEEKLRLITNDIDAKSAKDAQCRKLTATKQPSLAVDPPQVLNVEDREHPKRKANRAEKRLPSAAEDSQPNDDQISANANPASGRINRISTPSRYHHGQAIGTTLVSSPLEDLDDMLDDLGDLAGLFPPTPVPAAHASGSKKKPATQDIETSQGKAGEELSPTKRLTASRDSQSTTHMAIHCSQSAKSRHNLAATSPLYQAQLSNFSTQSSRHDQPDAHRQQTTSRQSARRHSILQESTVEKRSASTAGLSPSNARGRSKRIKDLGSVIPDSQPAHGSRVPTRNHRPAKLNSKKKPKEDKYSRRFSQELKQDL